MCSGCVYDTELLRLTNKAAFLKRSSCQPWRRGKQLTTEYKSGLLRSIASGGSESGNFIQTPPMFRTTNPHQTVTALCLFPDCASVVFNSTDDGPRVRNSKQGAGMLQTCLTMFSIYVFQAHNTTPFYSSIFPASVPSLCCPDFPEFDSYL